MEKYKLLKEQLKILKLDSINEMFYQKAEECRKNSVDFIDYLSELISEQVSRNLERSVNYRLRNAKFPFVKTVEQFDFTYQSSIDRKKYLELLDFDFIKKSENIIFQGLPGVGKTHLAVGIGVKACEKKIRTLFINASEVIEQLRIAKMSKTLGNFIDYLSRFPLLIIDELGYLPINNEDSNLFFQLISRKYENSSIIITTNHNFKEWGKIFNDDIIASAIIDRLLHHCHLFKIIGESYRIKDKNLEKTKDS